VNRCCEGRRNLSPKPPVSALQLHLFAGHSPAYQDALAHYEEIRPILKRERTLAQQSREICLNYGRPWRHLVKMAIDSLGYRYGHMTIWQMVTLYKQAHLPTSRGKRTPNPDERPQQAIAPHQVWFADLQYLVKIGGRWLYSVLFFDGDSRAIVGAGCFDRQNFAQLVQVFRQAMARWGRPRRSSVTMERCLSHFSPVSHSWQSSEHRSPRAIPGRTSLRGASRSSVGCWMPMWQAVRIERRCIGNMPSSCRTISSGAIGRTNARTPKASLLRISGSHPGQCQGALHRSRPSQARLLTSPTQAPGTPAWSDSSAQLRPLCGLGPLGADRRGPDL
jgi:hypothetical protein